MLNEYFNQTIKILELTEKIELELKKSFLEVPNSDIFFFLCYSLFATLSLRCLCLRDTSDRAKIFIAIVSSHSPSHKDLKYMQKKIYLMDGYGVIYRSYFAMIKSPMRNPQGKNISAIHNFFSTLLRFFNEYKPEYFIVVMDPKGKTFRDEIYPQYKAQRDKTPDDLHEQVEDIKSVLHDLKIRTLLIDNFEADDVIGSYAELAKSADIEVSIISNDKDLMQLVDEKVSQIRFDKEGITLMGPKEVEESKGIPPEQIVDYLAILGDSSDNIPGVKGIGDKGAVKLLKEYKTLEAIYANRQYLPAGMQKKLVESRENAFLSQDLATIRREIPLELDLENSGLAQVTLDDARKRLRDWGLFRITDKLSQYFQENFQTPFTPSGDSNPQQEREVNRCDYPTILTRESFEEWMLRIEKAGIVAFDCETDSLNPMEARACGLSFALGKNDACYLPFRAEGTECLKIEDLLPRLKEVLESPKLRVIGQNIKYDIKVMRHWGVRVQGSFDTMIASWLLDSGGKHNLDYLANRYLNYEMIQFSEVVPKGKIFEEIPLAESKDYAAEDADITWQLYELFDKQLSEKKLQDLFSQIDMPLMNLLAKMEYKGISLKAEELKEFEAELTPKIEALESTIHELTGETFNLSSTKQLQKVLFENGPFTPIKKTKSGYSTNTAVLEELARQIPENPIPDLLIQYRGLLKLKNTYVEALPREINPKTGRVHTSFLVTGTATGRLASSNPNLQNIPVRAEEGRRIRNAFHAGEHSLLLSADYSQIELVVLAHLSRDPALIRAFQEGVDIHTRTAATLFKISEKEVGDQQRSIAKSINFGVMYGMSAFRLANELQISRGEAKEFIDAYFHEFSRVRDFIDETVKQAEERGYVKTFLGHERRLEYINSRNKMEKAGAERMAVNSCIQGSAADIVKVAMLCIDKQLTKRGLKSSLLLQVHDECILQLPESESEEVQTLVKKEMEGAVKLLVPLRVSLSVGESWGDIH